MDELGDRWRAEILQGVRLLPETGAVPGTLVVWGEVARPILLSAGPAKPIIIATCEFGKGRIAVVAHNGILSSKRGDYGTLDTNLRRWLTEGLDTTGTVLKTGTSAGSVGQGSLLVWSGGELGTSPDFVLSHVLDGGSLLHMMCPWGWLQLNPNKTLEDMPLYPVLETAGICYTDSYAHIPAHGLDVPSQRISTDSHVLLNLRRILQNPDAFKADDTEAPVLGLSSVPESVRAEIFGSDLQAFVSTVGMQRRGFHLDQLAPSAKSPVKACNKRVLMSILECAERMHLTDGCLPGVEMFPGNFRSQPPQVCPILDVSSPFGDTKPTGYYLPPGKTLKLHVENDQVPDGWSVRVGAHSDNLNQLDQIRRWPQIVEKKLINKRDLEVHSPFGGLVYMESPERLSNIRVGLENVVEAPIFDLTDPKSVASWPSRRLAPGLWADISGELITITLPASSVRELDDPSAVMTKWDDVVRAHHDLRGTKPKKREWVVTDEQPSAGYMHSGYPIVTHLDVAQRDNDHFLMSEKVLERKGNWGMYHELGHNMQRSSWTFDGTVEVTCNIFTLHAMEVVSRQRPWIHEWLQGNQSSAVAYVNTDSQDFKTWKREPGVALFVYAQIAHEFGWDVYKRVFRHYESLTGNDCLNTDQKKIDYWFREISKACQHNLGPLFELWKVPLSRGVVESMRNLPNFLPDDELTRACSRRVSQIIGKYRNCTRVASK